MPYRRNAPGDDPPLWSRAAIKPPFFDIWAVIWSLAIIITPVRNPSVRRNALLLAGPTVGQCRFYQNAAPDARINVTSWSGILIPEASVLSAVAHAQRRDE